MISIDRLLRFAPLSLLLLYGNGAFAASYTWNVDASANWNMNASWTPATGFPNAVDDQADFGAIITAPRTVTLGANIIVGSITFDNVNGYTVSNGGNSLTMNASSGTAVITVTTQTGAHTISSPLVLATNLSITQSSTGIFTLSGIVSGTPAITLGGSQTLLLSNAANSFSGGITISNGVLQVAADGALGNTSGAVTIGAGTFQAGASFSTAAARSFVLTGSGSFDSNGNTLTVPSVISGAGSLNKIGTGVLVLSGTNTYTGGTSITAGTLSVSAEANMGASTGALAIKNTATLLTTASFTSSRPISLTGSTTINNGGNGVAFTGVISGSGSVTFAGAGTTTLSGTNTYSGGTTISAGTLVGNSRSLQGNIVNGGTLNFDQTFQGTYAGSLSGAGPLIINGGGALQMTGNSSGFTGTTSLTGSTALVMNGNLSGSALTIAAGSLLRGTGVVGTTSNFGRIYPGNTNAIGTLTVSGNLTFMANSSYALDIEPLLGSRIAVSGTATLPGGSVSVNTLPGFYGLNASYTILTAGNVVGIFDSLTVNNTNFVGSLSYSPTNVVLNVLILRPFLDFPFGNSNEMAVGINIDDLNSSGQIPPDLASVIDGLAGQSPEVINDALDQMHPAAMSAFAELQAEVGGQILTLFHRKPTLLCGCTSPNRIWIEPFGNWLKEKQQGMQIGFDTTTRGIAFGFDREFFDLWTVGVGGAWNQTDLTWSLNRGHAYIGALYGAFYSDVSIDNFYVAGSAYAGRDWYHTARGIHFPGVDRQSDGEYHGLDIGGQLYTAYFFGSPACLLYPYGIVDYLYLQNESFTEEGAESLSLSVSSYTSQTLRSEAGIALQVNDKNSLETICISPLVAFGWAMEWPLQRSHYNAAFAGASIPFNVTGWHQTWQLLNLRFGLGITCYCFNLDSEYILDISPDGGSPLFNQRANFRFSYDF